MNLKLKATVTAIEEATIPVPSFWADRDGEHYIGVIDENTVATALTVGDYINVRVCPPRDVEEKLIRVQQSWKQISEDQFMQGYEKARRSTDLKLKSTTEGIVK